MLKKVLAVAALPFALLLSTPSQAALEGDACTASNYGSTVQYSCSVLNDGQYMTINEIYKLGYRVVASYAYEKKSYAVVIIEKQS